MNGEAVRSGARTRQRSIPARLTLTILPLAVVALLAGLFYTWIVVTADEAEGLSQSDIVATVVASVIVLVALLTIVNVYRIGRSLSSRISDVTEAATRVADREIVNLLDVRGTIDPNIKGIRPLGLETGLDDEVGEMARSLEHLRSSMFDASARHVENLRSSVSSVLVTLARRNGSLVDRQLAVLDELEAREEDPMTLAGFYKVDHLAARMRRNAESLLILAGAESPRMWSKATEMVDVVRAAVSEVDEYQRVEVLALEPARLSGGAASDVAHLLAELIDNAVQYSPPDEAVRVTGLFNFGGYQVTVSDRGIGMSEERVAQLNRILSKPPALGFAVEQTLGLRVVSKLAHRHEILVELMPAVPGISVQITIPRQRLESVPDEVSEDGGEAPAERERTAWRFAGQYSPKRPELPVKEPAASTEDVVDLTASEVTKPAGRGLTVRTPGSTLTEEEMTNIPVGESTGGIRSALSAFDEGRTAAERDREDDE